MENSTLILMFNIWSIAHASCSVSLQGFSIDDRGCKGNYGVQSGCVVQIWLNGRRVYGVPYEQQRGIHVALINITSCSLLEEPRQCDTWGSKQANLCVVDGMQSFSSLWSDVFVGVVTGDAYDFSIDQRAIDSLRMLGYAPDAVFRTRIASFAFFGRPGCEHSGYVFSGRGKGPTNLTVDVTDFIEKGKLECASSCNANEGCTSWQHYGGKCRLVIQTIGEQSTQQSGDVIQKYFSRCSEFGHFSKK